MKTSLIVAMARNHVIGIDNRLPWKLPADLAWFKKNSMGKPLLMGRKTWESLPFRPLPGRKHFVISSNPKYLACKPDGTHVAEERVTIVDSIPQALEQAEQYCVEQTDTQEVMIIGGASIYAKALDFCDRMYLTVIDEDIHGDAEFPRFNPDDWQESFKQSHPADEKNPHPFHFYILDRHKQ